MHGFNMIHKSMKISGYYYFIFSFVNIRTVIDVDIFDSIIDTIKHARTYQLFFANMSKKNCCFGKI